MINSSDTTAAHTASPAQARPPHTRTYALAAALLALAVAFALLPGAPRAAAAAASLTISPGPHQFTGGMRLTLTGNIGVRGRRTVVLEQNMGRSDSAWKKRPGARGRTRRDGSFTLHIKGNGMWGFSYRVRSGKHRTPSVTTYAKAQDVILTQTSHGVVGQPLEFLADTVGRGYSGYRELPAPVLEGRTLTLQRRVSPSVWEDVTTTSVGADGLATLATTHRRDGDVYRVRAEDWQRNGDDVGWTASYPHYVTKAPGRIKPGTFGSSRTIDASSATRHTASAKKKRKKKRSGSGLRRHAHSTYGWAGRDGVTQRWEWEYGESLSSPHYYARGKKRQRNRWADGSDGTGRVTLRNGGMLLRSDGYGSANGDARGSTWAALTHKGERRGRWEVRGSITPLGGGARHSLRYELVPLAQTHQVCGTSSIVVAETQGPGTPLRIGTRAANGTTWGRTVGASPSGPNSYAVQVTRKHITWYVNGKPVATLRAKAALPKGPMAMRIMLAGRHDTTMATTKNTVDWVRTYSLKRGKKATTKKRPKKGAAFGGC